MLVNDGTADLAGGSLRLSLLRCGRGLAVLCLALEINDIALNTVGDVLSCQQINELIAIREKMGITAGGVPACSPVATNTTDVLSTSGPVNPKPVLRTFGQEPASGCGCGGDASVSEEQVRAITQAVMARLKQG